MKYLLLAVCVLLSGCALRVGRIPHASFMVMRPIHCYPCITVANDEAGIGLIVIAGKRFPVSFGYVLE